MANLQQYRNIGIFAHVDAGKTTTTERILSLTGKIHSIGEVHDGAATTDFMQQERDRGITIQSAATSTFWKDHKLNILDTPGHVDFTIEVYRSLKVLDGGVAVFCCSGGVEPQSETNWRYATDAQISRVIYVNKLDRLGADYYRVIEHIKTRLGVTPLVITLPIGAEENFVGLVDLVTMKAHIWADDNDPESVVISEIPEDMLEKAQEYRTELVETAVEMDDDAMMMYLEGEEIDEATLKACIRKGTIELKFFPTLCGSAFKNKGVQNVLDAVVDYLPNPTEAKPQAITDKAGVPTGEVATVDRAESFKALVFKVMNDQFGALYFTRVYSGKIAKGDSVYNTTTGKKERIGRIVEMHADKREELDGAEAGDIVAFVGLKTASTGHSLSAMDNPVILEKMEFPDPVISLAIEPKTTEDMERMGMALNKLMAEDPSFVVESDPETGQTIIKGMGELQLEVKIELLRTDHNVNVTVGLPKVSYREAITQTVEDSYTHRKQSGGAGQFAKIEYILEPNRGNGYEFVNKITGGAIDKEYIPNVERGFKEGMLVGPVAKYPVEDLKVTLFDGQTHDVDSSQMAFELAAKAAYRQSMKKGAPVLLEPVMLVNVTAPEEQLGSVIGDLNSRRGMIKSQDPQPGGVSRIEAIVPLAKMFGYISELRTITSGRGNFTMEFSSYEQCPKHVQDEIVAVIELKS